VGLEEYRAKRDFRKSPEPRGERGNAYRRPIFVVQEHHATRLHYDIRLEADGVLKSWAVPREPSMDPAQKRLAVRVEDHPLAYAEFAGPIPRGQYGAGVVSVWDKGTYDNLLADKPTPQTVTESIESGRLEFELHGDKPRGRFALVRMRGRGRGKENWLLIKMRDRWVRPQSGADKLSPRKPKTEPSSNAAAHPARKAPPAGEIAFSHLDKVMYPDSAITKGDVVEFYRRIAPRLLPFLRDRPATLERLPEGVGGGRVTHFWQKNTPASYPDWIPRAVLPTGRGETVRYALVNDLPSLLYLVNQGTLTFHVWLSRVGDLDRPDYVLFDLDPGRAAFSDAVTVAEELRATLGREKRPAFVKTSGRTGLHVLVPWAAPGGYDEARAWAEAIAGRVVQALPDRATAERSKAKRGRRVYVDVMQNAKGHHVVPPYVLRAVPGAPVSTPLDWNELTPALDPARFNLRTIFRRLARRKSDPMAALAGSSLATVNG
jgi:bifunctional non-homologous end joining protein LigD